MWTLFFSRQMSFAASATEEVATSTRQSTPSRSNHCRATLEPTSGRFCWSAKTTSTLKPRGPKSCTAWRAAATEVAPVTSRYMPGHVHQHAEADRVGGLRPCAAPGQAAARGGGDGGGGGGPHEGAAVGVHGFVLPARRPSWGARSAGRAACTPAGYAARSARCELPPCSRRTGPRARRSTERSSPFQRGRTNTGPPGSSPLASGLIADRRQARGRNRSTATRAGMEGRKRHVAVDAKGLLLRGIKGRSRCQARLPHYVREDRAGTRR